MKLMNRTETIEEQIEHRIGRKLTEKVIRDIKNATEFNTPHLNGYVLGYLTALRDTGKLTENQINELWEEIRKRMKGARE